MNTWPAPARGRAGLVLLVVMICELVLGAEDADAAVDRDPRAIGGTVTALCRDGCEQLESALQRLPGIAVSRNALPGGERQLIRVRGMSDNQGAAIIDGRSMAAEDRPEDGLAGLREVLEVLDSESVEVLRGPPGSLFVGGSDVICRSAQAEAYASAQFAAVADDSGLTGGLLDLAGGTWDPRRQRVSIGPPSSPEALVAGRALDWVGLDARSPADFHLADTVRTLAAENGGVVYYEQAEECERVLLAVGPARTYVAGHTGSTTTQEEEDEFPDAFPVPEDDDDPVPRNDEDDEDEEGCCGLVAVSATVGEAGLETLTGTGAGHPLVAYPYTTEYMRPENPAVRQPARHDVAWGAYRVLLHSGSMLYPEDPDVSVVRRGFDFVFQRTYAGDMITDGGGLMGQRWDFSFNKRIVPLPAVPAEDGQYVEPVNAQTPLLYSDGRGRSERYTFKSYDRRLVRNFGYGASPGPVRWPTFVAHVTTYESPAGAFHEIQRYVLENPEDHPFQRHPDVKTEIGEAIFYVLRTKGHMQYVFNCRGQLIYVFDAHRNFMELHYDDDKINPLTHNPMLATIVDTQQRRYEITHQITGRGSYLTRHDCQVKSASQAPIFAIDTITDPWGRIADFDYDGDRRLTGATWRKGESTQDFTYRYVSEGGRDHLLEGVVRPADQASGQAFLTNRHTGGRITQQLLGGDASILRYPADGRAEVEDSLGNVIAYGLEEKTGGWVIATRTVDAGGDDVHVSRIEHNDATQVTRVTQPRGNVVVLTYDEANGEVAVPDSPIRNFLGHAPRGISGGALSGSLVTGTGTGGVNYRNDLSRGNLLSVTLEAGAADPEADPGSLTRAVTYEPLYNGVASHTDPKGQSDTFSYRYTPGFEGRWHTRWLPPVRNADGETFDDLTIQRSFDQAGSLTSFTDPSGNVTGYQPHATGLPQRIDYPAGPDYVMTRDERGNLVVDVPPGGPAVEIVHDLRDLPVATHLDPDGVNALTERNYDANGNLVSEIEHVVDVLPDDLPVSAPAQTTQINRVYTYDQLNRRTSERVVYQDTAGRLTDLVTERQYDGNGRVVWSRMPAPGRGTVEAVLSYDAAGALIRVGAGDQVLTMDYDANGNLVTEHENGELTRSYVYDGFDRLARIDDAAGGERRLTRDRNGNVVDDQFVGRLDLNEAATATLRRVEHEYDAHDRRIATIIHGLEGGYGNLSRRFVFDRGGRLTAEIDVRGGRTTTIRDALGRPERRVDAVGNEVELRYRDGRLTQIIEHELEARYDSDIGGFAEDTGVYVTTLRYDALGNLAVRNHEGQASRFFYDSRALVRLTEDAGGRWSASAYDGHGRLVRMERLGRTTRIDYGGSNLPLTVDNGLSEEFRRYDALGNLQRTDSNGATVRYAYDRRGRLESTTDARGRTTELAYDALGLVRSVTAGVRVDEYRRDGLGRIVRAESGPQDRVILERKFDGLGQLIRETQTLDGESHSVGVRWGSGLRSYTLEHPADIETFVALDALGRVVRTGSGYARNIYHYAGTGRLAGRESSAEAARSITVYGYDQQRRPAAMTHYDRRGRLASARAGYGPHGLEVLEEHFNPDERDGLPSVRRLVTQRYDALGRVSQRIGFDSRRSEPDNNWLHTYEHTINEYDDYNRLVRVGSYGVAEQNQYLVFDVFQGRDARVDHIEYGDGDPELVSRVITRSRVAPFDVPEGSAWAAWVPWIGRDNEALPDEYGGPPGVLDLADLEGQTGDCGDGGYCQTLTLERDANGNILSDGLFAFEYDHANRLQHAEDLHAESFQRTLSGRYVYGPLGRLHARRFELSNRFSSDPATVYEAFDLKNERYLYQDRTVIGELAEPLRDGPAPAWLARYVPHAAHDAPAQMQRRLNDDPGRPMRRFDLHYGLTGNVAFVTEDPQLAEEPFKRIDSVRHYNGEDAWQLSRRESFVADSTTRVPYTTAGSRHDSFVSMDRGQGGSGFVYDYRAARLVSLARYGQDNYADILDKAIEQHPKPDAVRQMEYAMAGITALAAAPVVAAAAPMVYTGYAAAGSWMGGAGTMASAAATDVAVQVGVSHLLGQDLSTDQLLMSAAISAVTGGLGGAVGRQVATRVASNQVAAAAITSVGVDTLTATALEVGLTGADFRQALIMNAVVGSVGAGIGSATGRFLAGRGPAPRHLEPEGPAGGAAEGMRVQRPTIEWPSPPPRRQAAPTRSRNPAARAAPAAPDPLAWEPLLARPTSIAQVKALLPLVNPGYAGDPLRRINCQRCTNRTSLLLRGGYTASQLRAARGKPPPGTMDLDIQRAVCHLEPLVQHGWIKTMDWQYIQSALEGVGPYAHGRIWGLRDGVPGHVWNVWYDGQAVWMIDGQIDTVATGSAARDMFYGEGYNNWAFLLENF